MGDAVASIVLAIDEPGRHQPRQRLAHRRNAHAADLLHFLEAQGRTRRQPAAQDRGAQHFPGMLASTFLHVKPADPDFRKC
jgi:hypothetical protein